MLFIEETTKNYRDKEVFKETMEYWSGDDKELCTEVDDKCVTACGHADM